MAHDASLTIQHSSDPDLASYLLTYTVNGSVVPPADWEQLKQGFDQQTFLYSTFRSQNNDQPPELVDNDTISVEVKAKDTAGNVSTVLTTPTETVPDVPPAPPSLVDFTVT